MINLTKIILSVSFASLCFVLCRYIAARFSRCNNIELYYLKAKESYALNVCAMKFNGVELYYRVLPFRLQKKYISFAESAVYHYIAEIKTHDDIEVKKLYTRDLRWYLDILQKVKQKKEYIDFVNEAFMLCRFTESEQQILGIEVL